MNNKFRMLESRVRKLEKQIINERGLFGDYDVTADDEFWDFDDDEFVDTSFGDNSNKKTSGSLNDKPIAKNGGATAEAFENVICDAIFYKGVMPENYELVDAITKTCHTNEPEVIFANLYESLRKTPLARANLQALPGKQPVTRKWIKLGFYDEYSAMPSGVPKTDIIGGNFHVSVKKKGGSQLMSGTVCETLATINAALLNTANELNDQLASLQDQMDSLTGKNGAKYKALLNKYDQLNAQREDILDKISDTKNVMDNIVSSGGSFKQRLDTDSGSARKDYYQYIAQKNNIELSMKNLNKAIRQLQDNDFSDDSNLAYGKMEIARKQFERNILNQIENNSSELHDAILREAITGEVKFGYGAPGCANYVLVWDEDGNCEVFNIDQYLKHIQGHNKFDLSYKSNSVKLKGGKTGQYDADIALRIVVNN
jgi:hypothetical protein